MLHAKYRFAASHILPYDNSAASHALPSYKQIIPSFAYTTWQSGHVVFARDDNPASLLSGKSGKQAGDWILQDANEQVAREQACNALLAVQLEGLQRSAEAFRTQKACHAADCQQLRCQVRLNIKSKNEHRKQKTELQERYKQQSIQFDANVQVKHMLTLTVHGCHCSRTQSKSSFLRLRKRSLFVSA